MTALINDPYLQRRLIRRRRAWGADRYDEVWDGVYVMNAMPNNEHQDLVSRLTYICQHVIVDPGLGKVQAGCNVSDRATQWRRNYRVPDVAVFLNDTSAVNKRSHWYGGPDLAIEIVSPHDRSRDKLEFYARVGTHELLIIDRAPWSLELYRLTTGTLTRVGRSTVDQPEHLQTEVVPLTWCLVRSEERPMVEASRSDGSQSWQA